MSMPRSPRRPAADLFHAAADRLLSERLLRTGAEERACTRSAARSRPSFWLISAKLGTILAHHFPCSVFRGCNRATGGAFASRDGRNRSRPAWHVQSFWKPRTFTHSSSSISKI